MPTVCPQTAWSYCTNSVFENHLLRRLRITPQDPTQEGPPRLPQEFPGVSAAGLDLLNRLLTYDPARRLSARAALRHPYLTTEAPLPKRPTDMPTFPSAHDQDARGWHARRSPPHCV